ncbi:MAG: ABC transporter ATP-binding protein [Rhodoferax sp.]|nr:ABC transporter ATP-binding protein [Rhodoferax sp.]
MSAQVMQEDAVAFNELVVEVEQTQPMPLSARFRCAPGQMLALVGPSGAGKTSMLRIMAGLMRPGQGVVRVGDRLWCDTARGLFVPPQKRHVGLVFQNYALMPHLDALSNVALALLHLPHPQRRERARHWLDHVHLTPEQQARRPAELSGGQQQRVAVARALAREPALLLLDEPFSAVDQMSRHSLYALLAELRRELNIPIVLVTHDLNEARLLCDQLVVMDAGRVLQQGEPASIHRAPRNARVADLMGIQNRFHGVWLGLTNEPGQAVTWVIHGEGIRLLAPPRSRPTTSAPRWPSYAIWVKSRWPRWCCRRHRARYCSSRSRNRNAPAWHWASAPACGWTWRWCM